jgi:hypothetical protein
VLAAHAAAVVFSSSACSPAPATSRAEQPAAAPAADADVVRARTAQHDAALDAAQRRLWAAWEVALQAHAAEVAALEAALARDVSALHLAAAAGAGRGALDERDFSAKPALAADDAMDV